MSVADERRDDENREDVPTRVRDAARLEALLQSGLMDTPPEEAFDRLTRLASAILKAPVALVSLVDDYRQFFKSAVGLSEPWASCRETPLTHSFCKHVVARNAPLVISDARDDPLVRDNKAVSDLGVVAYAGVPIVVGDQVLGSFCAIDGVPRAWTVQDMRVLSDLAQSVVSEINLRARTHEAEEFAAMAERERREKTLLLDSAGEGIYGIDRDGRCTFINRAGLAMLGYELSEVLGRSMHALIHHSQADGSPYPEDACPMLDALRDGVARRVDSEVLWRRNGTCFTADYTSHPIVTDGEIKGAVVTFSDITPRKRAERRLAVQFAVASVIAAAPSADDALPALLGAVGEGLGWTTGIVWKVDEKADVLRFHAAWNSGARPATDFVAQCRTLTFRRNEGLLGRVWQTAEVRWSEDVLKEPDFLRAAAAEADGLHGALALPLRAGDRVFGMMEMFCRLPRRPDFELVHTVASIGDQIGQFLERKRVEDALWLANRAIEATGTGLLISDAGAPDLPVVYCNPAFETITGYSRAEVIGRNCRFLQGPDTDPDVVRTIRETLGQERGGRFVLKNYRKDGTAFWNDLSLAPVRDASDRLTHIVGIQVDITERKQIEEELERARDAADVANQAKSQFLANMSHELRTPLSAILGYSELLEEEAAESGREDVVSDLRKIETSARHLLSLINDILDLSKIEAGKMDVYVEEFDVAAMIEEVAVTIRPLILKKNNTLELTVGSDLGRMRSDVTKLRQSLFNLLSNASKFTENGAVRLSAEREPAADGASEWLVFRITDTGIGMSSEDLQKLFQRFSQADSSTTRKYGGTGLGLALSKTFSQMLGGDLTVRSAPGKGSTFTLRLPAAMPAPERPRAGRSARAPDEAEGPAAAERPVLVIDDDAAVRDLLNRFLSKEGYRVVAAADGAEGLRLAKALRPFAVLLDVIMPKVDGWAVISAIKADPDLVDIPVIIVSMVDDRRLGYALGAAEYLTKPVQWSRLKPILQRCRQDQARSVLIVEDDATTRDWLRELLEKEGWAVETAADGRQALDAIAENSPALILLDLLMPGMNGFELLAEIRKVEPWRSIPVVVLTAKELSPADRELLSSQVRGILSKGAMTSQDLLRQLRELAPCSVSIGGESASP